MSVIRFKNFVPKDEDLRPLYQEGASVSSMYRSVERELNQAASSVKNFPVSKTPLRPNWDLKKMCYTRNKRLGVATAKAIAKLNGSADIEMEDESSGPVMPESADKLSFIPHEELSEDEDDMEFKETRKMMGKISKHDLDNSG